MGSTYLNLTNRLLRRLNEVEISQSDFPSVRGIQATSKDAIQDAVRHINNHSTHWPFNAESTSQLLVVGQEEYSWPVDFASVDWDSFQIEKDDNLSTNTHPLGLINRDTWYNRLKSLDDDSGSDGRSRPNYVFNGHGNTFGISPSPDKAYTLLYRYYKIPDDLSAYDDEVTIPTRFDYVIIAAALMHMDIFKSDAEAYDRIKTDFKVYLNDMTNQLLPNEESLTDTRVNFGGGRAFNRMWTGYNG